MINALRILMLTYHRLLVFYQLTGEVQRLIVFPYSLSPFFSFRFVYLSLFAWL